MLCATGHRNDVVQTRGNAPLTGIVPSPNHEFSTGGKLLVAPICNTGGIACDESIMVHHTFGQIANVGAVDNTGAPVTFAGFPTGFQPVSINPGPDGIFGTQDDLIDPVTTQSQPTWAMSGCSREIVITNLSSTLKRIQVTLQYQDSGGQTRNLVAVSYLNDDSKSNFN